MITKTDYLKHSIYDKEKRVEKIEVEMLKLSAKRENYKIEIKQLNKKIKEVLRNE